MGGAADEQEAAAPAPAVVAPMLQPEGEVLQESMVPASELTCSSWGGAYDLFGCSSYPRGASGWLGPLVCLFAVLEELPCNSWEFCIRFSLYCYGLPLASQDLCLTGLAVLRHLDSIPFLC